MWRVNSATTLQPTLRQVLPATYTYTHACMQIDARPLNQPAAVPETKLRATIAADDSTDVTCIPSYRH